MALKPHQIPGRKQPNGNLVFPQRGKPPEIPEGYVRSKGDPFVLVPLTPTPVAKKPCKDCNKKKSLWSRVKESWNKADSFVKSLNSRGITGERTDLKTKQLRILSCHGDRNTRFCEFRAFSETKKFHYCNQCGCGDNELARLDSIGSEVDKPLFIEGDYLKIDYPYLECPLQKQGFSNAKGDVA